METDVLTTRCKLITEVNGKKKKRKKKYLQRSNVRALIIEAPEDL